LTHSNDIFKIKKRAGYISLILGTLIFSSKVVAYLLTGSAAIFSDAAESIVNIVAALMALYSIYLSSKPADKNHLYGHGNVEYFSAGIEGFLILTAATAIIITAVRDIIIGSEPDQLSIGTIIIALAGIINLFLGLFLIREGEKTYSITLIADGKHILTDSYTSLGVVVGLLLVLITGYSILDPVFAILIAINIVVSGFKLIRESIGGLMNETDDELLHAIADKIIELRQDYWIDVHQLKFWTSSERLYLDFHLILPYYFTIKQSHEEDEKIESELRSLRQNTDIRIHLDYCDFSMCKYCKHSECHVRKEELSETENWTVDSLIGQPVHSQD